MKKHNQLLTMAWICLALMLICSIFGLSDWYGAFFGLWFIAIISSIISSHFYFKRWREHIKNKYKS